MRARALIGSVLGVLATASIAGAIPVVTNVGHLGYPGTPFDANTLTDPWTEALIEADTRTTQFDTSGPAGLSVGDVFQDSGHAILKGFNFLPGFDDDSEGLAQAGGYDITVTWSGVTGYVSQIDPPGVDGKQNTNLKYLPGGVFNFYFDPTRDANLGTTAALTDDAGFTEVSPFMTITLTSGNGTNTFNFASGSPVFVSGSSQLFGRVSALDAGYLFEYPSGLDLTSYVSLNWLIGEVNQNTQTRLLQTVNEGGTLGGKPELFTVYSRHDGSLSLDVVPEPGTMILMGSGLLGLAGLSRRRSKKT